MLPKFWCFTDGYKGCMCIHTHGGRQSLSNLKQEQDETEEIPLFYFCGPWVRLNQYFHLNNRGAAGRN